MNPLKTILTACVVFLSCISVNAQTYTAMPTGVGTTWGYRCEDGPMNSFPGCGSNSVSIVKDTLIGGLTYHKFSDGSFFREVNKQIFVLPAFVSVYTQNPVGTGCVNTPNETKTLDFNITSIGQVIQGGLYDGATISAINQVLMLDGLYHTQYQVHIPNAGGCSSSQTWVEGIGITQAGYFEHYNTFETLTATNNQQKLSNSIQIYPNPVQNRRFRIQTDDPLPIESIEITNTLGQRVFFEKNNPNIATQDIETPSLPLGIYTLTLQTDKGRATKKLLIE